ncbi:sigma-70 family RNA polymerase sigma factor [Stigmatella aurantiaca]|nr:sigma-70 family RNA polymerase sigma factor [Stigmatella aurantiaca]
MMSQAPTHTGAEEAVSDVRESKTTRSEQQAALVARIMFARETGDTVAERALSAELLASVCPIIKSVVNCSKPFADSPLSKDLEQVASIAVLRTICKYDPTRGGQSFGEVAYFRARTACEQFARMHASDVHLSDWAHKGRTSHSAHGESDTIRVESTDALAPASDEPSGQSRGAVEFEAAFRAFTSREAEAESPEQALLAEERRVHVFNAVRRLAPVKRELVSRVYGINQSAQSVRSVAEAWGVPKSRVDRMLVLSLAELRELLTTQEG